VIVGLIGAGDREPMRTLLTAAFAARVDITDDSDADFTVENDGESIRVYHRRPGRTESDLIDGTAVDLIEASLTGTQFEFVRNGERTPVNLRLVGERQVPSAAAVLVIAAESGLNLETAAERIRAVSAAGRWRMSVSTRADGATIVNDAHGATARSMAEALRALAQFTVTGRRSVAVLGEFDVDEGERVEAHDAIGRLVVRLNIAKLVAVGNGARHIHSAAGLEGSWDGESVIVANNDQAYDLLRDEIRGGDVVLVKAARSVDLGTLGDRLSEGAS
jgi:UDP-N-acetylmuramoyl-tripeptide--D-alanyl-D-alanine ligase